MASKKRSSRRSRPLSARQRSERYAKAMAMPTIGKWKGSNGYFHIDFEGRRYIVNPAHGGYTLSVRHGHGGDEYINHVGGSGGDVAYLFKTPAQAVAAARKFSAREGWA